MRSRLLLAAIALALPLLVVAPSDAEAQCWHCHDLSCIESGEVRGADNPCNYEDTCYGGSCWWDCFPSGDPCNISPESVSMSGQIVVTQGDLGDESMFADLTAVNEQRGVYRGTCKDILVVFDEARRSSINDRDLGRLVLQ